LRARVGRAQFLEPRFNGATRFPECLHDLVLVSVVGELRQDTMTRPEQLLQMIGFVHAGNLAAGQPLKTAPFSSNPPRRPKAAHHLGAAPGKYVKEMPGEQSAEAMRRAKSTVPNDS